MLVAHDQLIKQPCILAFQPLGNLQALLANQFLSFPDADRRAVVAEPNIVITNV